MARQAARGAAAGGDAICATRRCAAGRARHAQARRSRASRSARDEMLAREIAEELDKAMPKPAQLMSHEDQQAAVRAGASGRRRLRQRAQEMAKELGKPTPRTRRQADADAGPNELSATGCARPGSTWSAPADELREQAPREARRRGGAGAGEAEPDEGADAAASGGPRSSRRAGAWTRSRCSIPGADEYRAPKEFRQDLLDAMKRGAPAEYKEQVKRYYEELVEVSRALVSSLRARWRRAAPPGAASPEHAYELIEEWRIEEAAARARAAGRARIRTIPRSRSSTATWRSSAATTRAPAERFGEADEAARPRRRREPSSCAIWRGHRRTRPRASSRCAAALRHLARAGQGRAARALRARGAGEGVGARSGDDFGGQADRAGPRRDLPRGRRSGARCRR